MSFVAYTQVHSCTHSQTHAHRLNEGHSGIWVSWASTQAADRSACVSSWVSAVFSVCDLLSPCCGWCRIITPLPPCLLLALSVTDTNTHLHTSAPSWSRLAANTAALKCSARYWSDGMSSEPPNRRTHTCAHTHTHIQNQLNRLELSRLCIIFWLFLTTSKDCL